jgi:hypothetical protein
MCSFNKATLLLYLDLEALGSGDGGDAAPDGGLHRPLQMQIARVRQTPDL